MHKNKTRGKKKNRKKINTFSSSSSNQSLLPSHNHKFTRMRKLTPHSQSTLEQPQRATPLSPPSLMNSAQVTPIPMSHHSLNNPILPLASNFSGFTIISESDDNSSQRVNVLPELPITFRLTQLSPKEGIQTKSISTPFVLFCILPDQAN